MRGKQIAKNENQRLLVSEETEQEKGQIAKNENQRLLVSEETEPVSYTHLTLPTTAEV